MILKDFPPSIQLALFWSFKEASFKFCKRTNDISFVPAKFRLSQIKESHTEIKQEQRPDLSLDDSDSSRNAHFDIIIDSEFGRLKGKSHLSENYVHSIVCEQKDCFDDVHWGIGKIASTTYEEQTQTVRTLAIDHFQYVNASCSFEELEFRKTKDNIPVLYLDNKETPNYFSFSHHDQYVAYAWYGKNF